MAIREATTRVEEPAKGKPRPDRRRRRQDLRPGPFPTAGLEQWQDTEAALTQLYRYAEGRAIEATDWYLADKRGKRIWSRAAPGRHPPGHRGCPPAPAAGRLRRHGRPHAAGDGRVGAGVPEQPAAPGDLDGRRFVGCCPGSPRDRAGRGRVAGPRWRGVARTIGAADGSVG